MTNNLHAASVAKRRGSVQSLLNIALLCMWVDKLTLAVVDKDLPLGRVRCIYAKQSAHWFQCSLSKTRRYFVFDVTGNVDWQAVPIAYWQDIVAIIQQHGLQKLLVLNRKKYKPASGDELVQ